MVYIKDVDGVKHALNEDHIQGIRYPGTTFDDVWIIVRGSMTLRVFLEEFLLVAQEFEAPAGFVHELRRAYYVRKLKWLTDKGTEKERVDLVKEIAIYFLADLEVRSINGAMFRPGALEFAGKDEWVVFRTQACQDEIARVKLDSRKLVIEHNEHGLVTTIKDPEFE